jgi:S-adenosyl-L-methionine hydrolase (adenosine-forming)
MSRPIITLTTDFGVGSPYVAEMKGVLLSINAESRLVDITHAVPPQDIRWGALVLGDTAGWFPPGTIHVAVVDPGVGTTRRLIGVECEGHCFLGPDNGIFSRVLGGRAVTRQVELTEPRYWRDHLSHTFHGRDILAPVAAHRALGVPLEQLGTPCRDLFQLEFAEPAVQKGVIWGECLLVDSFGNLVTNISRRLLEPLGETAWEISMAQRTITRFVRTYGDGAEGELLALLGSHDRLEIAQVNGSAARELGAGVGMPIQVRRADRS